MLETQTEEEVLQGMNYVEFITRCKVDFQFFCERLLGLTEYGGIHSFQMEWFYLIQNSKVSVIEAAAGFSKTEIVGVAYPLYYILNHPKSKVLLVSKTIKQAETNLLERIKGYIASNPVMQRLFKPQKETIWNKTQITLADGSTVTNVPYNINIRSYRANLIVLDEADTYEDTDLYFSEVTSRLIPGGKICIISTPKGAANLLGILKSKKSKGHSFLKTTALVNIKTGEPATKPYVEKEVRSIWPERFSVKYLLEERKAIGYDNFELVYMCNVITSRDALFSIESISECFNPEKGFDTNLYPDAQYFIACDFATSKGPKADSDAYTVVEKRGTKVSIKYSESWKGKLVPFKEKRIEDLYNQYQNGKTVKLIFDPNNVGSEVARRMRGKGITIIYQKFDHNSRKDLLRTLANVFESREIEIPFASKDNKATEFANKILKQAIGFTIKKSEAGNEVYLSNAPHDDELISLAMAVKYAVSTRGCNLIGKSK